MKILASMCGLISAFVLMGVAGGHEKQGSVTPPNAAAVDLPEKLEVYIAQAKHGSVEQRQDAIVALGRIAERAQAAVPALTTGLKNGNASRRMYAAEALWKINKEPAAVAAMIEDLKDREWQVRRDAAGVLGRFGKAAKAAVPALVEAHNDKVTFVRSAADLALWQIDKHPAAIPALIATLKDADSAGHRAGAADALGAIGAEAKAAVPALLEALKDQPWTAAENSAFHIPAAKALWQINKHPAAVPALMQALQEQEGGRRLDAVEALGSIGADAKAAVPALAEALKDEKNFVRKSAAEALWRINKHPAAVPALAEALANPDDAWWAAAALRRIGEEAKAAMPALVEALKDEKVYNRVDAALTLWQIKKAPAAVAVLLQALKTTDEDGMNGYARVAAARALWQIKNDPAAGAALLKSLKCKDVSVRAAAAEALWQINRHPAAVPALVEVFKSEGGGVTALRRIGVEGNAARTALVAALKDEDECVRNSAAEALKKLNAKAVEGLTPVPAPVHKPSLKQPRKTNAADPDDKDIERLVKQLGNDKFKEREAATKRLNEVGEPARAALRKAAASSTDVEIRQRASRLIRALNAKLQILCYVLHSERVTGVAFSPDGQRLLSASDDGTVRLIEVSTGKLIHCLAHPSAYSVAFSPDGKKAISTGSGVNHQTLRLWDLETGKELQRFAGYQSQVCGAAFAPDGKQVLYGACLDKTVRLLDIESGKDSRRFEGHTADVDTIALSTDGKTSLSGSYDATVRLWDNATGKELRRFDGHEDRVYAVALSKDGKRGVSGGKEHVIKLWDLATGKEIRQLEAHAFGVHGLAFSGDGRRIASANHDANTVSLWDAETGEELHRFEGHTDAVYDVAFSPDGRFLVSGGKDKSVRVWRVP